MVPNHHQHRIIANLHRLTFMVLFVMPCKDLHPHNPHPITRYITRGSPYTPGSAHGIVQEARQCWPVHSPSASTGAGMTELTGNDLPVSVLVKVGQPCSLSGCKVLKRKCLEGDKVIGAQVQEVAPGRCTTVDQPSPHMRHSCTLRQDTTNPRAHT